MPDEMELEEFLIRMFDEGDVVRFERGPDVIDVEPVESSRMKGDESELEGDIPRDREGGVR